MNVTQAVANATARIAGNAELKENSRRDAELLLMHALDWRREALIANSTQHLSAAQLTYYGYLVGQRHAGKPIQYITHRQQFWGLDFNVNESVLIPRPETEHLVEAALELLPADRPVTVIDVGTGSGAIAIAIAHDRPEARIRATDISPEALNTARINSEHHDVYDRIEWVECDLMAKIADESADMVVSNPPYVATTERDSLAAEVREYEPAAALFAGPTGLEVYARLVPAARIALKQNGWLLMEIGAGQRAEIERMLKESGYTGVRFVDDLQNIPRVAIAQKP